MTVLASLAAAAACLAWALLLRRRLGRVADAEHELRGALTAVALGVGRCADRRLAAALQAPLARALAALDHGFTERCSLEHLVRSSFIAWDSTSTHGGNEGDLAGFGDASVAAGPAATVLGNLVSNAVEHGDGAVAVRIEVANAVSERSLNGYGRHGSLNRSTKRGRGLRIAERAARAAGGRLDVRAGEGRFAAVVELPVER